MKNRPGGGLSWWAIVLVGSCPSEENCPDGELSK